MYGFSNCGESPLIIRYEPRQMTIILRAPRPVVQFKLWFSELSKSARLGIHYHVIARRAIVMALLAMTYFYLTAP